MNLIKDQIDEFKQMQKFPRFHLSNYFDELKRQIDLKYVLNFNEKDKYLEIIKNIELFEQEAYKKCKPINTFDNEINSIENELNDLNLIEIEQLIDELKFKIEKVLFSNKSIFFYEEYSLLIILNDEYIRKKCIDSESMEILTREKLIAWILKDLIKRTVDNQNNEIIEFKSDSKCNDLNNLKDIYPKLFYRLTNLEIIDLSYNTIEVIHGNTFNGLSNLKKIDLSGNQIKEIPTNTFNGLTILNSINFGENRIEDINPHLFNGLVNLRILIFNNNRIQIIPEKTLSCLVNLEVIDFNSMRHNFYYNLINFLL